MKCTHKEYDVACLEPYDAICKNCGKILTDEEMLK